MKIKSRRILAILLAVSSIFIGAGCFYLFGFVGALSCPILFMIGLYIDLKTDELEKQRGRA